MIPDNDVSVRKSRTEGSSKVGKNSSKDLVQSPRFSSMKWTASLEVENKAALAGFTGNCVIFGSPDVSTFTNFAHTLSLETSCSQSLSGKAESKMGEVNPLRIG